MARAYLYSLGLIGALTWLLVAGTTTKRLALIKAGSGDLLYEVSPGPCNKGTCPLLVRLMQNGRELDAQVLEAVSSPADFKPTGFKRANGAGDPLGSSENAQAFTSGEEENSVTLTVRPITLTPELNGALIDVRTGFEHVKRNHQIFAAYDGKLRKLWSSEEGAGPTYSTTALTSSVGGHQRLIYFSFFSYPGESEPDKLSIEAFAYDANSRKLIPDKVPLKGLLAGPYATVAEARKVRTHRKNCRVPFWVLPASGFAKGKEGFVVAVVSASPDNISLASHELKSCAAGTSFSSYSAELDTLTMW